MTGPELALILFTACNSIRVLAYVPQIAAVVRDRNGASAISYTTWGMFAVSHFSTVVYAYLVLLDPRMAGIFAANTVCCVLIVALTAHKRGLFRLAVRPELRGRFGVLAVSAVFIAGVALALTLGSPSNTASQTAPAFATKDDRQITVTTDVAAQRSAGPPTAEASLDHYARLLSQSHGTYWEQSRSTPWPFTLTGTWNVEASAWRMFELDDAAAITAFPWLTAFPLGEKEQRTTTRATIVNASKRLSATAAPAKVSRPGSKAGASSNLRR